MQPDRGRGIYSSDSFLERATVGNLQPHQYRSNDQLILYIPVPRRFQLALELSREILGDVRCRDSVSAKNTYVDLRIILHTATYLDVTSDVTAVSLGSALGRQEQGQ